MRGRARCARRAAAGVGARAVRCGAVRSIQVEEKVRRIHESVTLREDALAATRQTVAEARNAASSVSTT